MLANLGIRISGFLSAAFASNEAHVRLAPALLDNAFFGTIAVTTVLDRKQVVCFDEPFSERLTVCSRLKMQSIRRAIAEYVCCDGTN